MLNIVENWRYVGRAAKTIVYTTNIIAASVALFMILTFIPGGDVNYSKLDLTQYFIQLIIIYNLPLLFVLNTSGSIRRHISERRDDNDT